MDKSLVESKDMDFIYLHCLLTLHVNSLICKTPITRCSHNSYSLAEHRPMIYMPALSITVGTVPALSISAASQLCDISIKAD